MEFTFGISGGALDWMKSYLRNRKQYVVISGERSAPKPLECGVPQGSYIGPKAFKRYSRPLGTIAHQHGLLYHIYADDTQLYIAFQPDCASSLKDALHKIQAGVLDIKSWMTTNYLKLNEDKTEILIVSRKNVILPDGLQTIDIANAPIIPSVAVKNLGVIFDRSLSMDMQIASVCKKAFFEIHNISKIRKYLTADATKSLVHSYVISKLDYCNAYTGIKWQGSIISFFYKHLSGAAYAAYKRIK